MLEFLIYSLDVYYMWHTVLGIVSNMESYEEDTLVRLQEKTIQFIYTGATGKKSKNFQISIQTVSWRKNSISPGLDGMAVKCFRQRE